MDIWIVFAGETLPMDDATRQWRYGMLAETLIERGHKVIRWAPTFNHSHKKQRYNTDHIYKVNENYKIELLYNRGYKRNIGFQRLLSYIQLARSFQRRIKNESSPDIIISGMPTPWLCSVAIKYGKQKNIPVIIDVRDLWPDIFLDILPNKFRPIAKNLFIPLIISNKKIFQRATAIYGVSERYLKWGMTYTERERTTGMDKVFPLGYKKVLLSNEQIELEKKYLEKKGVDNGKLICCYFGQLESTYDIETIVEAANVFKTSKDRHVQFVLCGQGSKMNSLIKQLDEDANIIFLGWVAPSTLNVLMDVAAVGLASYAKNAPQSLPNKPFEYFSGGLPVISSLHGELEQILFENNCGLTYEAGDVQGLVDAILYLKNNPEKRAQMGKDAKCLFEEKYSADKIYPAMADHIEGIVNRGNCKLAG
jgi:glycosyltransferase involved in cell wall biosynthesis